MKQKLRVFCTLLLLAVASTFGNLPALADIYTIGWGTASGDNSKNFTSTIGEVTGILKFDCETNDATTSCAYNSNNSDLRLYYNSQGNGGSITITPAEGVTITGFVMTTSTSPSVNYFIDGGNPISVSATSNTYTVENISVSSSLKIQNVNKTNTQLRIKTIQISYTTSGTITPTCDTPTFSPAAGEVEVGTVVTISTATDGATIYYTTNGDTPTTSSTQGNTVTISKNMTIKAIAVKADCNDSEVAEATYTVLEPFVIEDGVFNFECMRSDYGSGVSTTSDGKHYETEDATWIAGNVTLVTSGKYRWWKNDGTMRFYSAEGSGMTFSVPDGKVIKSIVITGGLNFTANVGTYTSGTWTGQAQTVTLSYPETSSSVNVKTVTVTYEDGTPAVEKVDIATINGISPTTLTVGDLGEFTLDATFADEAYTIAWASDKTDVLDVADKTYEAKAAGTANVTVTITPTDTEAYKTVSKSFAVTVEEAEQEGNWVLTSLSELTTSDVFVIVGNNGSNYAMSNNNSTSSAPSAVAVTVSDNNLTGDISDNIKWNISGNATDGYTFYPNGSTTTWLYCTNSNNGVRVGDNINKTFKVVDDYLQHVGTSRYVGVYNSSDWRCYTTINSNIEKQTFAFYKFVAGAPTPSITAEDVEIAYNATSGSISYTVNNPVDDGELTATDNADWLTIGTVGETVPFTTDVNPLVTARTAEVVLTYTYGENRVTKTVIVTQKGNPNGKGTENNPYSVSEALEVIATLADGGKTENVYTTGTITQIEEVSLEFGNATYFITDGKNDLYVYHGKYYGNNFTSENQIQVGDKVVVYGQLQKYVKNGTVTPEIASSNNIVKKESAVVIDENSEDNAAVATLQNKNAVIKRTFVANYWNTFMMPFNGVTKTQLMKIFGSDVIIKAVKVDINNEDEYILTGVEGNTISFSDYTDYSTGEFQNSLNYLYLIKPSHDVVNPVFTDVTSTAFALTMTYSSEDGNLKIVGSPNKIAMTADEGFTAYYLSTEGKIKKAASGATLKGTRFYFQTKNGVEAKIFIDDEATSIEAIDNGEQASGKQEIFNLAGQRVNKAQKGIYIVNGKKVVVK